MFSVYSSASNVALIKPTGYGEMIMTRSAFLFLLVIFLSGCVPADGGYSTQYTVKESQIRAKQVSERLDRMVRQPIVNFKNEPTVNCQSENLSIAWESILAAESVHDKKASSGSYGHSLSMGQQEANWNLDLAEVALDKKCLDVSEKIYNHVMKRFIGSAYTAYRERAMIGIQKITSARAMQ